MKNIFSFKAKRQQSKSDPIVITAEQIQGDIHGAQEALLKEAEAILYSSKEKDIHAAERYEKLFKLGFVKIDDVVQHNLAKENIIRAELVKYYQQSYPNNKFITYEIIKTVCERYGLIFASVYQYKDTIPVKNQNEIINFLVKADDVPAEMVAPTVSMVGRAAHDDAIKEHENKKGTFISGVCLHIIAPINKLETRGYRQAGIQLVLEDPVVLQPVTGGYLIVSAWGEEAADENIVNPKHN